MRIKILHISLIFLIISGIISCFVWSSNYNSKIISISVNGGEVKDTMVYQLGSFKTIEEHSDYCILLEMKFSDSLMSAGKRKISSVLVPLNCLYGAYDPGREYNYSFKDTIKNIEIESLHDFCDSLKAGKSLNSLFEVYSTYPYWWKVSDPFNIAKSLPSQNLKSFINQEIQETNNRSPNSDYGPDFILRLKYRPDKAKQRFVVTMILNSGIIISDTTITAKFRI